MRGWLFAILKEQTATGRTCGLLFLALSSAIVLPPVVINVLMGGKMLKAIARLLTGYGPNVAIDVLGPMLVTFFLPAIIAAILGVVLLLGKHDRSCGKLLLWYVGFSIFMLVWSLLPIPWKAMGVPNAYASRLDSFMWHALYGLFLMEGWVVFLHVPVIVLLWGLSLFVGWNAISQHGRPVGTVQASS